MDARRLFLSQHSAVHSTAVGGNPGSISEQAFGGLTDEQMRIRPREDLNSLAWLMWHIARSEDAVVNRVLAARPQVLDDEWVARLRISRRDVGPGMTSAEVQDVTSQVDLGALRDYRDAVGRRTREIVAAFETADWEGECTAAAVARAADDGAFGRLTEMLVKLFTGRPRAMLLSGIAIIHPARHLGEVTTIRGLGGFSNGF
jgi:hypothetical protein